MGNAKKARTIHYMQRAHLKTPLQDTKIPKNGIKLQSFAGLDISPRFLCHPTRRGRTHEIQLQTLPEGSTSRTRRGSFIRLCVHNQKKMRSTGSTERSAENGERWGHTLEQIDQKIVERTRVRETLPGMNKWAKEKRKETT